jgi:hypothetical protein
MVKYIFPTAWVLSLRRSGLLAVVLLLLFLTTAYALDITLAWDENKESDLAGYRIYYKKGSHGPPYKGTGALQGDSPIEIPLESLENPRAPQFAISGLSDDDVWYFVATAYNGQGLESDYSNFVSTDSRRSVVPWWLLFDVED